LAERAEVLEQATIAPTTGTRAASGPRAIALGGIRAWPAHRKYIAVLLLLFAVKQAFNVVVFPPFTGHDEVAHYAYIRTVADEHRIPVIPDLAKWRAAWQAHQTPLPGDFLPDELYPYCRYVLDWNYCDDPQWANNPPRAVTWAGEIYPHGWQYAANHPPLYYAMMAPIYAVTGSLSPQSQQYVLRAAAIPIGLMVVLLTYLIAGLLFPGDRFMMTVAPTFVAFQTQVSYEAAMVNNDILLIGFFTLLIYLLIRSVRRGFTLQSSAVIGLVLGLGLLAKASMLTAAPLVAIAVIFGVGIRHVRRWVTLGVTSAVVAALVCWPWYLFLYRTYGNLSGLAQIKALQYLWTYRFETPPTIFDELFSLNFARMRWNETWGEFGWRLIHLDGWLLAVIGIPLLIMAVAAIVSLVMASVRRLSAGSVDGPGLDRAQVLGLWLLLAVCVIAYGAMLQFGTDFSLTQARYYFNAIAAVAILVAFGLRQIVPARHHSTAIVVFLLFFVTVNLLIYTQYVLPYWYLAS
jgi:4-amino-4-deoxy-L-arabinose transferase-like glycosyltransferase